MALQISYDSQYGVTATEAYVRIDRFRGEKQFIAVDCCYYYNEAARTNGQQPIGYHSFTLNISNGATMEQMYTALKDDSNFIGAVDC